jgi:hypothetical protein
MSAREAERLIKFLDKNPQGKKPFSIPLGPIRIWKTGKEEWLKRIKGRN